MYGPPIYRLHQCNIQWDSQFYRFIYCSLNSHLVDFLWLYKLKLIIPNNRTSRNLTRMVCADLYPASRTWKNLILFTMRIPYHIIISPRFLLSTIHTAKNVDPTLNCTGLLYSMTSAGESVSANRLKIGKSPNLRKS